MDDEALLEGLRAGDERTVEYTVQQYAPALFRYVYYQLQDASAAEDVVSEVMTRMIERIDSFVPTGARFQAWLFSIARNLVADHYRARRRRPQVSLGAWLSANPGEEPGSLDPSITALPEREELQTALAKVTPEQRLVILLHVVDGYELPHVARLLERSLPSVKSLYYRGIRSMRTALAHADQ